MQKQRDAEMKKGGTLSKLEEEKGQLEKDRVKLGTQVEIKQGSIRDEEARIGTSEDAVKTVSRANCYFVSCLIFGFRSLRTP